MYQNYKQIWLSRVSSLPANDQDNALVPCPEFSWLDRFTTLKDSILIKCAGNKIATACIESGELSVASEYAKREIYLEIPYYTDASLHEQHAVLPLGDCNSMQLPEWISKDAPEYFFSSLVLIGPKRLYTFYEDYANYADFNAYFIKKYGKKVGKIPLQWGIKVILSKLPYGVAVGRDFCFSLGHKDMTLPFSLGISPTNLCNLRCTICGSQPTIEAKGIPKTFMTREVLENIAATILPICHIVELNSLGEPTLHRDFDYFIEIINKNGCNLILQSNGTNFNDKVLKALSSASGVVSLSIDATGALFEQQRVNASWEKVSKNIEKLLAVRDPSKLQVWLYPTITRRTLPDAINLCKWSEKLGVDGIVFHYYEPIKNGIEETPTADEKQAFEQSLNKFINDEQPIMEIRIATNTFKKRSSAFKRPLKHSAKRLCCEAKVLLHQGVHYTKRRLRINTGEKYIPKKYYDSNAPRLNAQDSNAHKDYVCTAPILNMVIDMSGEYSPCCRTQSFVLGKFTNDAEFFSLWFGEKQNAFRHELSRESSLENILPECKACIEQNNPK